ncbi:hypothetical protein P8452_58827 [Trifolium repens]|nr:hypothetical protein P8452_58827 [Trifolium repens]
MGVAFNTKLEKSDFRSNAWAVGSIAKTVVKYGRTFNTSLIRRCLQADPHSSWLLIEDSSQLHHWYWSLKEASVKATGSGLIEGLNKVEFSHSNWTNISAAMDGKVMALLRFWLTELGESHCETFFQFD